MIGLELNSPCRAIVDGCAASGLLVNCANETTIRLLPPLNVTRKELDKALKHTWQSIRRMKKDLLQLTDLSRERHRVADKGPRPG